MPNHHTETERLAHERTVLANDRTMLAHFRTGLAGIGTGIVFFKFFPDFGSLTLIITALLIGFGLFFFITGFAFYPTRNRLLRHMKKQYAHTDELVDDLLDEENTGESVLR